MHVSPFFILGYVNCTASNS